MIFFVVEFVNGFKEAATLQRSEKMTWKSESRSLTTKKQQQKIKIKPNKKNHL